MVTGSDVTTQDELLNRKSNKVVPELTATKESNALFDVTLSISGFLLVQNPSNGKLGKFMAVFSQIEVEGSFAVLPSMTFML